MGPLLKVANGRLPVQLDKSWDDILIKMANLEKIYFDDVFDDTSNDGDGE